MAVYAGPEVVTNGLVLALDAGNSQSYPGSGTTWTDLSGLGNNGTLTNGPTFSFGNNGSIIFDGTNDHATTNKIIVPSSASPYTVSVWCRRDRNNVGYEELLSQWTFANANLSFFFGFDNSNVRFTDNWNPITVPGAGDTGIWMNLVGVYSVSNAFIYLNGSLIATKGSGFSYTGTGNFVIGRQGELTQEYFDGDISNIQIYNRALSAAEIRQNYNALKSRFPIPTIVTEGLILHLDAANPQSYPGSGTTWTDLSGRGNNGDIKSGVTYANNSFNFTLNSANELIDIAHSQDLNYSYLNWAYSLWMKINFDDNGTWTQLFIKGNDNLNRRPGIWFYSGATSRFHFAWGSSSQGQTTIDSTYGLTNPIGVWANWVFQSRNGVLMIHKNCVQDTATLSISDRLVNNEPLHIGGYSSRSPGIDLASFMVYNKSLTDEEIRQNFNATRGRFGI